MHPRVLREVAEQVSEMLTDIFNSSLESGQVLEDWRVVNVTPLSKKGSREELGNYRPVGLTSCREVVRDINYEPDEEPFK